MIVEAPVAHLGSVDDYAIDHINFDPTDPAWHSLRMLVPVKLPLTRSRQGFRVLVEKDSIEFATGKDSAHRIRMPATTPRGLDATLIQLSCNRI